MNDNDPIDIMSNVPDDDNGDDYEDISSDISSGYSDYRPSFSHSSNHLGRRDGYDDDDLYDYQNIRSSKHSIEEIKNSKKNAKNSSSASRKHSKKHSKKTAGGSKEKSNSKSYDKADDAVKGKKGAKKKKTPLKRAISYIWKSIVAVFLVFVITGSIVVTALTVYVMKFIDPDPGIDLTQLRNGYNTTIYATDSSGKDVVVHEISNGEHHEWVDLDDIPYNVRNAFIYTEDQRFYEHEGVDWKRTFGAFVNMFIDIYGFRQGGSTITQQLIKCITGNDEVKVERKVQEIFKAINLEKKYTKDDILEAYLNIVYLGYNTYGVQAASKLYFEKDVSELTVVEASALAAMTRNPSRYDPIENPEENKGRREYVLKQLYDNNIIQEDEYNEYLTADLETVDEAYAGGSDQVVVKNAVQSYFVDTVVEEVIADLMEEKGWDYETADEAVRSEGYRIYTTMDIDAQEILEKKYKQNSTFSSANLPDVQSAMIIMDHYGAIKAVVGGRGEKTASRVLNRATQSKRSPGSSIKPLAAYAPAIEDNLITYSTMYKDEPIETIIGGKTKKWPSNYDHNYHGTVPIVEALRRSFNTIPVKLIEEMSATKSYNFLTKKLGITTLVDGVKINGTTHTDKSLGALAMGDMTYGTKLSELTAAYQIFANGGTYTKPRSYTKVLSQVGETVLSNEEPVSEQVISEDTAGVMLKLMQQVVESYDGTGRLAKLDGISVAGKTGTSNESTDQLFIGITPYYIAGVWFGYDEQKNVEGIGMNSPALIWNKVMSQVLKDYPDKDFDLPSSVKKREYCTSTGLLANSGCPKATGYYREGNIPKRCNIH